LKNELTHIADTCGKKAKNANPSHFLPERKSHKGSTTLPREIVLRAKDEVQVVLTIFLQGHDKKLYIP
jgi:rRNA maturation protein Nop10